MIERVEMKISATTNSKSAAGALAGMIREGKDVVLTACGHSACGQAVKAIAIARGYVATNGYNLVTAIGFSSAYVSGQIKTIMRFIIIIN